MTTNTLIAKFGKYVVGAFIGFLLFWLVQQLFFSKDREEPSGRNYKKENTQLQGEVDRLRLDSLEQRTKLRDRIKQSQQEELDLRIKLRKWERHYETLNFKSHTFDQLDSIRDRTLSDLRQE